MSAADDEQARAEAALAAAMARTRAEAVVYPWLSDEQRQYTPIRFIAVGGKPAAGKDTFADHLVAEHGFVKTFYSEPLNEALIVLAPQVRVPLWHRIKNFRNLGFRRHTYATLVQRLGYTQAKTIPEVRRLLQFMGTDVGRNLIDDDIWVNQARKWVQAHLVAGESVVLTGVRMPNELDLVRELGGHSVYVSRTGTGHPHPYENALTALDFDTHIHNSGTREELQAKATEFLENL